MAILAAGTHGSFKRGSNKHQFHCGRCSMKTVPSPQTSWLVFIAEAGFASWQPSAPRKSRAGFWITSEFPHARLRWRRQSSSNFPSPSNDHGQLKLRVGVSLLLRRALPTALIFTRLRKSCSRPGQLSPQVNINCNYVTSPQPRKPRKRPDTCGMAFEKLILPPPKKLQQTRAALAPSQHNGEHF